MTTVKFYKNENNFFTKVQVSGHTGFGAEGTDVLCASISGIVQAGVLGITRVVGVPANVQKNDQTGCLQIELPTNLSKKQMQDCQIVLGTMYESIADLKTGYSKFIKLEVK